MPQNICRHIRPSGRRCQTPAVRNRALCYFHQNLTEKHNGDIPTFLQTVATAFPGQLDPVHLRRNPLEQQYFGIRPAGPSDIDLPPLEDRESLQIALSTILNALAQNRIDHRRAGTLLYGLQIAVANLRSTYPTDADDSASSLEVVIETVPDEHGQLLCPASPELPGPAPETAPPPASNVRSKTKEGRRGQPPFTMRTLA